MEEGALSPSVKAQVVILFEIRARGVGQQEMGVRVVKGLRHGFGAHQSEGKGDGRVHFPFILSSSHTCSLLSLTLKGGQKMPYHAENHFKNLGFKKCEMEYDMYVCVCNILLMVI